MRIAAPTFRRAQADRYPGQERQQRPPQRRRHPRTSRAVSLRSTTGQDPQPSERDAAEPSLKSIE